MSYALLTLWHERQRYLPGILAVGFSALLIALQCGLLLGLFSITSMPIDHTRADVWLGAPAVLSVDLGRPISESQLALLYNDPHIDPLKVEPYVQGFSYWAKPDGGTELCMVVGGRLEPDSLGRIEELTPELCARLSQPMAVVVDDSDLKRLGIQGVGDHVEVNGRRIEIVGITKGLKSLAGPYVMCNLETARALLRLQPDQVTYGLARCEDRTKAREVVEELRRQAPQLSSFTAFDFSYTSRMHWLTKTKAGIALGYAAALGLLVGAVVTSQTLYAATAASLREYAVLRALGIPRWRMAWMVMQQSFWVGVIGIALAMPAIFGAANLADHLGVKVDLPWWLITSAIAITLATALLAGLVALRSLRLVEPATLLR
jgi:putative ABC transport system permease protein